MLIPCFFLASAGELSPLTIPLSMLVVFVSAKILAELFERLGQPGIVGEILAGILIGPYVLGWMAPNVVLTVLADLGVMFLLFRVGLEVKSSDLLKVGGTALLVATAGVVLPFLMGWAIMAAWGFPSLESIFTGAAMVATSVGITAQVLSAKGLLSARASQIILAAAVIDDVLGLLILALVSSMAKGKVDLLELTLTAGIAVGFTVFVAKWGTRTMDRVMPRMEARMSLAESQFALSMALLFGLALLAVYAGVAAIVGAFLAGMALSESVDRRVHQLADGVTELLVPFFLVGIGLHFDLTAFATGSTMLLAVVILAAAIVSKLLGCGLGALSLGRKDAMRVGAGMVPRGEVGMVVAQIGRSLGVIEPGVYGIVVFMSVATTLVAPPLLNYTYRGMEQPPKPDEEIMRLG
ncbi:MAG TPA: cation:proton antiporter [Bryobacteraceae bacterium]|nr:cation:proton antiporter [Bryobacteraceae bacterium]